MSVEGDRLAFDDAVESDHDVDPTDVDWRTVFAEHGGDDGILGASVRTDAVIEEVDGIENSRQAESLLADAADRGVIDRQNNDYVIDHDPIEEIEVDWHAVFESVAKGIDQPLPSSGKRGFLIQNELGLESEDQAHELVERARERGIIVQAEVNGSSGLFLSNGLDDARATTDTDETATPDETTTETRPELEALREQSSDVEEYANNLEGLLTDVLDRLETVEERQERQDDRFHEYVKEKNEEQRVGLTELQIRRLREGDMLSTDGVEMDVLHDEFGDDLVEVSGGSAVRLAEPKTDEDSSRSTQLPNFDDYCELEAERLRLHLDLRTPEDVKNDGVYKHRCLTIWSNAETLATQNGEFPGQMVITKGQVESWLWKHARNGADRKSMDTICNRTMNEMADKTDGVIEKKIRNGNSVLVFGQDELEGARCPRFQARSIDREDGGDLITPLL